MNNNQKRHFHTNSDVSTNQVFTLLDAVWSDNKDEVDKLTNDFDTKFIAPEEIKLIGNPSNVNALTLEANTYVVDQGPTYTKELETNKKRKKNRIKYPNQMEKQRFSTLFSRILSSWGQSCQPIWRKYFSFRYLWTNY